MKKLLLITLALCSIASFAEESQPDVLGTPDRPLINGVPYEVHKVYLEPNQGYSDAPEDKPAASTPKISTKQAINKVSSNFKSDSWATDEKVEKALKQAASAGKLDYVLGRAKEKNLPATVAVVPIVESNYNSKAVSAKGAAGAWQIMPKTASGYGIESKQRFDFQNSTDLALQILGDLHEQFGNWQLAFAAYNCGSQCVINALKKNPDAKSIDELSLPNETRDYVHKIMQINQVLSRLDVNDQQKH